LGIGIFEGQVQRRGVHVNTPKIGSRVGELCLEEFYWFYAVLRRESIWGNFNLVNLGFLSGGLTWACEEGGPFSVFIACLGEFIGPIELVWGIWVRNLLE
jgi:hypothetical protein